MTDAAYPLHSGSESFQQGRCQSDGQRKASQGATADALPEQAEVSRPAPVGKIKQRTVRGWLLQCINDHGPITQNNADSAAKRVYGQISGCVTNGEEIDTYWKRRYRKLKFAYDRLLEREETSVSERVEVSFATAMARPATDIAKGIAKAKTIPDLMKVVKDACEGHELGIWPGPVTFKMDGITATIEFDGGPELDTRSFCERESA